MAVIERRNAVIGLEDQDRVAFLGELTEAERRQLLAYWPFWARLEQMPSPGDWRNWLVMAGRGFGKTRAGAEWVRRIALSDASARIALVASSILEARAVMVEGESGILACHTDKTRPRFESSLRRLVWENGAQATLSPQQNLRDCAGRNIATLAVQAQKEFTVNEAFALIDALLHGVVEGESNDPPAALADGECWIVGTQPTGDWSDHASQIACRQAGNWLFAAPFDGLVIFDKSAAKIARHDAGWVSAASVTLPTGGTTIDTEARTAIAEIVDAMGAAGILPAA